MRLPLDKFLERYGAEQQCIDALARWRWRDGFNCPKCGCTEFHQLAHRGLRQCYSCRRQTSPTSGTAISHTKLPLTVWFYGVYLAEKRGSKPIGTVELAFELGISGHAASRMKPRLQRLMGDEENPLRLERTVGDMT